MYEKMINLKIYTFNNILRLNNCNCNVVFVIILKMRIIKNKRTYKRIFLN